MRLNHVLKDIFVLSLVGKNVKIAQKYPFFKQALSLNVFAKNEQKYMFKRKLCTLHNTNIFACENYILPRTMVNKASSKPITLPLSSSKTTIARYISGVSRMAYARGANRGRGFGAPGQIEEWRPSAEVLDGGRGLDARSDYFFFR